MRNSRGEIVEKVKRADENGREKSLKQTYRDLLRKITNNGADQFEVMTAISKGEAFTPTRRMPDGTVQYGEPIVPSVTNMMMASQWLIEYLHGKAVVQTEVSAAEAEAQYSEQVRALSDAELEGQIIELLAEKGKIVLPSATEAHGRAQDSDENSADRGRPSLRDGQLEEEPLEE